MATYIDLTEESEWPLSAEPQDWSRAQSQPDGGITSAPRDQSRSARQIGEVEPHEGALVTEQPLNDGDAQRNDFPIRHSLGPSAQGDSTGLMSGTRASDDANHDATLGQTEAGPSKQGSALYHSEGTARLRDAAELSLPEMVGIWDKHFPTMYEDHEYFTKQCLINARRCYHRGTSDDSQEKSSLTSGPSAVPDRFISDVSPFAAMKGIQRPGKDSASRTIIMAHDHFTDSRSNKTIKTFMSIPTTEFESDTADATLPAFKSYSSLRHNVLAENNRKLLYWPYFGDEDTDDEELREELNSRFDPLIDQRPRRLLQTQKSHKLLPYTKLFLEEIGSSFEAITRFLLDPNGAAGCEKHLRAAHADSCGVDFNRDKRKWKLVFEALPSLSTNAETVAAQACYIFHRSCGLSIWHVVKVSGVTDAILNHIEQSGQSDTEPTTFREIACRVCHLHNCPYHGEICETESSDGSGSNDSSNQSNESDDSDGSAESVLESDNETSQINFKKQMTIQNGKPSSTGESFLASYKLPRRSSAWWLANSKTHLLHERRPFYPCSHAGLLCDEAGERCSCLTANVTCEKSCACPDRCKRRFRGCTCARARRACFQDRRCECFLLNRECDQDLCGSCGAEQKLNPVNRYNKTITSSCCANVNIQRNVPKRTLMGHSEVQGFGLYMGEKVRAHEFIGEYKGEVITKGEADRRGTIYQHLLTNYLFSLNADQEVDSTRAGNKFRFINNSELDETINCYSKVMLCNTVTRIGMYAKRDIQVGEELFFNYGYPKDATLRFWERGEDASEAIDKAKRARAADKVTAAANAEEAAKGKKRRSKHKTVRQKATRSVAAVASQVVPAPAPSPTIPPAATWADSDTPMVDAGVEFKAEPPSSNYRDAGSSDSDSDSPRRIIRRKRAMPDVQLPSEDSVRAFYNDEDEDESTVDHDDNDANDDDDGDGSFPAPLVDSASESEEGEEGSDSADGEYTESEGPRTTGRMVERQTRRRSGPR